MAEFAGQWAFVNLLVLSLMVPTEIFAPRLVADFADRGLNVEDGLLVLVRYGVIVWFGSSVALFVYEFLRAGFDINTFAGPLFAAGCISSSIFRSAAISIDDFNLYFKISFLSACMSCVLLSFVLVSDLPSGMWSGPLVAVGLGSILTMIYRPLRRLLPPFRRIGFRRFSQSLEPLEPVKGLIVATFVSLAIENLGVIIGRWLRVNESQVVGYSTAISLVLAPLVLLNSFTPPLLTRATHLAVNGEMAAFRSLFRKSVCAYLLVVCVLAAVFCVLGNLAIGLYVGSQYELPVRALLALAVGVGMMTVNVLPRVFATSSGHTRGHTRIWLLSLLAYVLALALPISPIAKISLAPSIAALLVFVFSTALLELDLRSLVAGRR